MFQEFSATEAHSMPVKKRVMKRRSTRSSGGLTIKNIKKPKCEYGTCTDGTLNNFIHWRDGSVRPDVEYVVIVHS
jgi:hypothetical protein